MSGSRFLEFVAALAATDPVDADKFVRLDAGTGATQVSTWRQILDIMDSRYPRVVQTTQAEYDAITTPEPTTFYVVIG